MRLTRLFNFTVYIMTGLFIFMYGSFIAIFMYRRVLSLPGMPNLLNQGLVSEMSNDPSESRNNANARPLRVNLRRGNNNQNNQPTSNARLSQEQSRELLDIAARLDGMLNNANSSNNRPSARNVAQLRERMNEIRRSAAIMANLENRRHSADAIVANMNTEQPTEIDATKSLLFPELPPLPNQIKSNSKNSEIEMTHSQNSWVPTSHDIIQYTSSNNNNPIVLPLGMIFSSITEALPRVGRFVERMNLNNNQNRSAADILNNPRIYDFNAQNHSNTNLSSRTQEVIFNRTRSALSIITYLLILLFAINIVSSLMQSLISLTSQAIRSSYRTGRAINSEIRRVRSIPSNRQENTNQASIQNTNNDWIE